MNVPKEKCKRASIFVDVTQEHSSKETFDAKRCFEKVVKPARDLIDGFSNIELVLIIRCGDGSAHTEVPILREGTRGMPCPHVTSPSSEYLVEAMRKQRADGLFTYLNICAAAVSSETFLSMVVSHARGLLTDASLLYTGGYFPTVEEVKQELATLARGEDRIFTEAALPA